MYDAKKYRREYYLKNKEKELTYAKEHRKNNPFYYKEYCRAWRNLHHEYLKKYFREYIKKYVWTSKRKELRTKALLKYNSKKSTKEKKRSWYLKIKNNPIFRIKSNEQSRKWKLNNPLKAYQHHKKWRSTFSGKLSTRIDSQKRRSIKYKLTRTKLVKAFNKTKGFCVYCNAPLTIKTGHLEHIKPISKGGTNHLNNLTYSCPSCNLKKRNYSLNQFKQRFIYCRVVNNIC